MTPAPFIPPTIWIVVTNYGDGFGVGSSDFCSDIASAVSVYVKRIKRGYSSEVLEVSIAKGTCFDVTDHAADMAKQWAEEAEDDEAEEYDFDTEAAIYERRLEAAE